MINITFTLEAFAIVFYLRIKGLSTHAIDEKSQMVTFHIYIAGHIFCPICIIIPPQENYVAIILSTLTSRFYTCTCNCMELHYMKLKRVSHVPQTLQVHVSTCYDHCMKGSKMNLGVRFQSASKTTHR